MAYFSMPNSIPISSLCILTACVFKRFARLFFQDGFWVGHTPLVRMVKLKLLAQFPVDLLPQLVVSSLILFLRQLTAFPYW